VGGIRGGEWRTQKRRSHGQTTLAFWKVGRRGGPDKKNLFEHRVLSLTVFPGWGYSRGRGSGGVGGAGGMGGWGGGGVGFVWGGGGGGGNKTGKCETILYLSTTPSTKTKNCLLGNVFLDRSVPRARRWDKRIKAEP